jgi:hypothetical protein
MPIKADTKYNGKIRAGSSLMTTQTGSLGYQVMLSCDDGPTSFTIWLTDKNRDKAVKTFTTILGVKLDDLKSQQYLEYQLALDIEGREVSFGTKEEEYNGKRTIKVAWIGKKSDPNVARGAATFFGGVPTVTGDGDPGITDEDIPFSEDVTWKDRIRLALSAELKRLLTNSMSIHRWVMGTLENARNAPKEIFA